MIDATRWKISGNKIETMDLPSYIRPFFFIQNVDRDNHPSRIRAKSVSKASLAILCVLLLSATHLNAEVHRLSMSEMVREVVQGIGQTLDESKSISVSSDDFVKKIPLMASLVIADDSLIGDRQFIEAVFAVKQANGGVADSTKVEMQRMGDDTFRASGASERELRRWLAKKVDDLMRGLISIEEVTGIPSDSVEFRLANVSAAAKAIKIVPKAAAKPHKDPVKAALSKLPGKSLTKERFKQIPGKYRKFEEFEGKVLLIHVWATWCAPCIAVMPELGSLQEQYDDQGLTVVNLSDESSREIRNWLSDNPTDTIHGIVRDFGFLLDSSTRKRYRNVNVRPVYLVVDRKGIVREQLVGARSTVLTEIVTDAEGNTRTTTNTSGTHYVRELVEPYL